MIKRIVYMCICWFCYVSLSIPLMPGYRVGRDSSVSIATRYVLDGPGIESLWGRDFPQPSIRVELYIYSPSGPSWHVLG